MDNFHRLNGKWLYLANILPIFATSIWGNHRGSNIMKIGTTSIPTKVFLLFVNLIFIINIILYLLQYNNISITIAFGTRTISNAIILESYLTWLITNFILVIIIFIVLIATRAWLLLWNLFIKFDIVKLNLTVLYFIVMNFELFLILGGSFLTPVLFD